MFKTIKERLDWNHGTGYCVEYRVYFNAPSWSTGKWFKVEGLTNEGSIVDLLDFAYDYDTRYNWLVAGTYTN